LKFTRDDDDANLTPLRRARLRLYERARTAKDRQRWTGIAVAAAADIDQGHLSRIEHGKCRAMPDQAERLVRVFPTGALNEVHVLYPERFMKPARKRD
jgi:transcriptional regulator with XRE-family HTH domain